MINDSVTSPMNPDELNAQMVQAARLKGNIDYYNKMLCIHLWWTVKKFIDDCFGEECRFFEWEFSAGSGILGIGFLAPYDKDKKPIAFTKETIGKSTTWSYDAPVGLMFAYDMETWDRECIMLPDNERIYMAGNAAIINGK